MNDLPYQAIVIGASAGGLEALMSIFKELPAQFPIPIIVVSHRLSVPDSYLNSLLGKSCSLQVQDAEHLDSIHAGNIYVAPASYHLLIADDYTFNLTVDPHVNSSRPSIDVTFETAASVYGKHLIGVLLTGASEDGARGMLKIHQEHGYTIVQDPKTAVADTMPKAAIALMKVDFIGSISEITEQLCRLCGVEVKSHA